MTIDYHQFHRVMFQIARLLQLLGQINSYCQMMCSLYSLVRTTRSHLLSVDKAINTLTLSYFNLKSYFNLRELGSPFPSIRHHTCPLYWWCHADQIWQTGRSNDSNHISKPFVYQRWKINPTVNQGLPPQENSKRSSRVGHVEIHLPCEG